MPVSGGGRHVSVSAVTIVLTVMALCTAHAMPDALGRQLFREIVSPEPSSSPPPERQRIKDSALERGARLARARGVYKANALQLPQHWVKSEDPAHPRLRCPVDAADSYAVNVMPENAFFKDHDSEVRSYCLVPDPRALILLALRT